jgi:ribonuclease-3
VANLQVLQEKLGYNFQDDSLLRLALTHPSASGKNSKPNEDNQRMEFLGDAILQVVISDELYSLHINHNEGSLTKARAGLVNGTSLAKKAAPLGLENHLIIGGLPVTDS